MIANRRMNSGRNGATANHAPGIGLRHRLLKQRRRIVPGRRPEKIAFAVFGNTGSVNVGAQFLGECMMARLS